MAAANRSVLEGFNRADFAKARRRRSATATAFPWRNLKAPASGGASKQESRQRHRLGSAPNRIQAGRPRTLSRNALSPVRSASGWPIKHARWADMCMEACDGQSQRQAFHRAKEARASAWAGRRAVSEIMDRCRLADGPVVWVCFCDAVAGAVDNYWTACSVHSKRQFGWPFCHAADGKRIGRVDTLLSLVYRHNLCRLGCRLGSRWKGQNAGIPAGHRHCDSDFTARIIARDARESPYGATDSTAALATGLPVGLASDRARIESGETRGRCNNLACRSPALCEVGTLSPPRTLSKLSDETSAPPRLGPFSCTTPSAHALTAHRPLDDSPLVSWKSLSLWPNLSVALREPSLSLQFLASQLAPSCRRGCLLRIRHCPLPTCLSGLFPMFASYFIRCLSQPSSGRASATSTPLLPPSLPDPKVPAVIR
jgi:hypothetical protein